jgi:hypothetical protein
VEKKSGCNVSTYCCTSSLTMLSHQKCFPLKCFISCSERWKSLGTRSVCLCYVEVGRGILGKTAARIALWLRLYESGCCGQKSFHLWADWAIYSSWLLSGVTVLHHSDLHSLLPTSTTLYSGKGGMVLLDDSVLPILLMHSVIFGIVLLKMPCPSTMHPRPCT